VRRGVRFFCTPLFLEQFAFIACYLFYCIFSLQERKPNKHPFFVGVIGELLIGPLQKWLIFWPSLLYDLNNLTHDAYIFYQYTM